MFRESKKTSASCVVQQCPSKTIRTASIALYILSGQPNLKKKKQLPNIFFKKKVGFLKKSSFVLRFFRNLIFLCGFRFTVSFLFSLHWLRREYFRRRF